MFLEIFLAKVAELLLPFLNFTDLSNEALVQLLLYGGNDLPNDVNRIILQLTLCFICETGQLWLGFWIQAHSGCKLLLKNIFSNVG